MAELDERHERLQPRAHPRELVLRLLRLDEARVVLHQHAAELPGELERLDRAAERRERRVGRLALVERHRGARLDVEGELVGRPLGPAARHVRVGEGVERRVDLDHVEALGVVAQPRLRRRDAARVPRLEEALVGPAARPEAHRCRHARTIDAPAPQGGAVAICKLLLTLEYAYIEEMETALKAIAAPRRRQILTLVRDGELSAGEIASHFDVTRPAVSQDLTLLKEAGLVDERRNGTRRLYRVRPEGMAELRAFLEEFWDTRLDALKREAEREEREKDGNDRHD